MPETSYIEYLRHLIEDQYKDHPTGCGGSFGELLCYEIHSQPHNPRMRYGRTGLTFKELADKWDISVTFLGELIANHCEKLEG